MFPDGDRRIVRRRCDSHGSGLGRRPRLGRFKKVFEVIPSNFQGECNPDRMWIIFYLIYYDITSVAAFVVIVSSSG